MALAEAMLKVLNNDEEPLKKRIKIANNAFQSIEFSINNKELFLLKWAVNKSLEQGNEDAWAFIKLWLSSEQFKELTQNDISNEDINSIIELFFKILKTDSEYLSKQITDSLVLLCDNKVFQQYFKYNLETFYTFLAPTINRINCSKDFVSFVKCTFLVSKTLQTEEKFHKHFLDLVFPALVGKIVEFVDNTEVFAEASKIVQKSLFQGNLKTFEVFFDQSLNISSEDKNEATSNSIPKTVFKYLSSVCSSTSASEISVQSYRLIFDAFSCSFCEYQWIYKFLIVFLHMQRFDVSSSFTVKLPFKVKCVNRISIALETILAVLDRVSKKSFSECEVNKIPVTEFLRKMIRTLIGLKIRTVTAYTIILRCIAINPLVIEPIASEVVVFAMRGDNKQFDPVNEQVVIEIFEVFAKLHRIENFMAKIVPALREGDKELKNLEDGVFSFNGDFDVEIKCDTVKCIFSDNIIKCFTNCINKLASWQVINLFKTLLYHLKVAVDEFAKHDDKKQDSRKLDFLELLGTFLNGLLQSVRMADHTVPQNVVAKFVNGLEELKDILKVFGPVILTREHNHISMRTFLNLSYVWAEIYITLSYYSINHEVQMTTVLENSVTACNLRFLHSYLDAKQWQLISQRISNFGEYPCKKFLQKLFVQKIRAMLLFQPSLDEAIIQCVIKALQAHLEDTWKDLLLDKFTVNFLVPKMDKLSLNFLAEHLIQNRELCELQHVRDSVTLTNAVIYVLISKINKLIKHKRKHDQAFKKSISSKIYALIPEELFFGVNELQLEKVFQNIKEAYGDSDDVGSDFKEEKLLEYLQVLRKFPHIYSKPEIQKVVLVYLFALHGSVAKVEKCKGEIECLIIGSLQALKFNLTDIFNTEVVCEQVIKHFDRDAVAFCLMVDNIFKHDDSVVHFESMVTTLVRRMESLKYLNASIMVLQATNKIKKSKFDSTTKELGNQYREKILNKIAKIVCNCDNLVEAYATCLKHFIASKTDSDTLEKLLKRLPAYMKFSMENIDESNKRGCAILFTTVLNNKQKIENFEADVVLKIWNTCRKIEVGDEYSHLVKLIVTLMPNEEFQVLVGDLTVATKGSIRLKNFPLLTKQLKTWESIFTCDVNAEKIKILQEALQSIVHVLLDILKNGQSDGNTFKNIVHLVECVIQTSHFILSPPLIDMLILSVTIISTQKNHPVEAILHHSISIMEKLLKFRTALIMDRLPAFLQQYRSILKLICTNSNSDDQGASLDVTKASDCAHKLEKLTKSLVGCKKDLSRIAVYLVADILERYEHVNLFPNVKLHLNNCVYSLMSLCDHHAVSYLMRVLSSASTEMFKILYEHYKKYYMFTGKV